MFPPVKIGHLFREKKLKLCRNAKKNPNPTKKKTTTTTKNQHNNPPPQHPTLLLHLSDLKPGPEGVPIFAYNHSEGHGAVIGGHVYRGQALRNLTGRYLFGDLFTKYEMAI